MSQAGIVNLEQSNPQIPTSFTADTGTAISLSNNIEILGGTNVVTSASGKTITITAGTGADVSQINGDTGSVLPTAGIVSIIGTSVQGISTSGAGDVLTLTVADATASQKGVSKFNTGDFTVTTGNVVLDVVSIAKGGTNSSTALSNGVIMISAGGSVVEGDPTVAELETLTDGSDAGSLHIHDARYYTETELSATASGSSGCSLIGAPSIGSPTYSTTCDRMNLFNSSGRNTGGATTDAGSENLSVAAGTGFIKATDSDVAEILAFDWDANASIATTTDTHQYAGIIYNAGTPIIDIRSTENYDLDTEFPLASIVNEGGSLHILNNPWWVTDGLTNIIERFRADGYIVRDNRIGGLINTVPGTRNLAVSAGTLWSNLNEFPVLSIDTSTPKVASHSAVFDVDNGSGKGTITASAGTPYTVLTEDEYIAITGTGDNDGTYKIETIAGGNVITMYTVIAGTDGTEATTVITRTFEYYSYNGVAGTWSDSHETQYSNLLWNDTTMAALQVISNNKYVNMWVYAEADDQEISMVYGQAEYISSAGAEAEAPPTLLPLHISEHGILIGRILIKQAVDAPVQVDTAWETTFTASQAATHSNLAGLGADDHPQYLLASGTRALAGAWDMGSQALTNVNVDSGTIDGITLGTNSPVTEAQVDNINIDGNTIEATDTNGNLNLQADGTGDLQLRTPAEANALVIDENGIVTKPLQSAFHAYNSNEDDAITGDGTAYTCDFDTEIYDQNADFSADTFTAPVTGIYTLKSWLYTVAWDGTQTTTSTDFVTSNRTYRKEEPAPATGEKTLSFAVDADMDAADTATVVLTASGGNKVVRIAGTTQTGGLQMSDFCGYLAC